MEEKSSDYIGEVTIVSPANEMNSALSPRSGSEKTAGSAVIESAVVLTEKLASFVPFFYFYFILFFLFLIFFYF